MLNLFCSYGRRLVKNVLGHDQTVSEVVCIIQHSEGTTEDQSISSQAMVHCAVLTVSLTNGLCKL